MGCMCMDCKHNDVITNNNEKMIRICTCEESENYLKHVSIVFDECDHGEVETEDEE